MSSSPQWAGEGAVEGGQGGGGWAISDPTALSRSMIIQTCSLRRPLVGRGRDAQPSRSTFQRRDVVISLGRLLDANSRADRQTGTDKMLSDPGKEQLLSWGRFQEAMSFQSKPEG